MSCGLGGSTSVMAKSDSCAFLRENRSSPFFPGPCIRLCHLVWMTLPYLTPADFASGPCIRFLLPFIWKALFRSLAQASLRRLACSRSPAVRRLPVDQEFQRSIIHV